MAVPYRNGSSPLSQPSDIVYNPKDTQILQAARRHGAKTLNGMYMLVAQAIGSEEIWMGRDIPFSVIEQIAKEMEHYYE